MSSDTKPSDAEQSGGGSLNAILAALQQGVIAINNMTQIMKTIFPSS